MNLGKKHTEAERSSPSFPLGYELRKAVKLGTEEMGKRQML